MLTCFIPTSFLSYRIYHQGIKLLHYIIDNEIFTPFLKLEKKRTEEFGSRCIKYGHLYHLDPKSFFFYLTSRFLLFHLIECFQYSSIFVFFFFIQSFKISLSILFCLVWFSFVHLQHLRSRTPSQYPDQNVKIRISISYLFLGNILKPSNFIR